MYTRLLAAAALVMLAGCSPTAPEPNPSDDALTGDPTTLAEIEQISDKLGNTPVNPITVVAEAGVVCNALQSSKNGLAGGGHQTMSWWQDGYSYHWRIECWPGYPAFPGSSAMEGCTSAPAMTELMDCQMVVESTWRVVRAIAGMQGYQVVWSDLQRDMLWDEYELKNYKVWFTDPSGTLWYWQWTKLAGIFQPEEG